MAVEDERAAIAFSVTLSGQLIAASMAMLAVEGAYVWYALGSRQPAAGFEIFAACAASFIAISIFTAGKGITKARDVGFKGKWHLEAGKTQFNLQAIFLLLALVTLAVTFTRSGPTKQSQIDKSVDELRKEVTSLRLDLAKQPALLQAVRGEFANQIQQLTLEVDSLRAQLGSGKNQAVPGSKKRSRRLSS